MNKIIISLLLVTSIFHNAYAANSETKPVISVVSENSNYTLAVIKKIDKENGKITLKHEKIEKLSMPAMTMIFKLRLADINLVDNLKVEDNIKAVLDKTGDGFIVKEIIIVP